jgi:hypothetical protein
MWKKMGAKVRPGEKTAAVLTALTHPITTLKREALL